MNAKKRLLNALSLQKIDRMPIAGLITSVCSESMEKSGFSFPDAHKKADDMAGLAAAAYEVMGLETVKVPFGMTVEAEALGAIIEFGGKDNFPQVKTKANTNIINTEINLEDQARVRVLLDAIRILKEKYNNKLVVASAVIGPLSLLSMLFGLSEIFMLMMDNKSKFKEYMHFSTEVAIKHARLQIEAGTDVIQIGEAAASGDLIGPLTYKELIFPYHKKLCEEIDIPVVLHICGNISSHSFYIKDLAIQGFSFDEKSDINILKENFAGKISLIGYVPTSLLLNGTPSEIYSASIECINNGVDVLNAGCALPLSTPIKNVKAMVKAVKEYKKEAV